MALEWKLKKCRIKEISKEKAEKQYNLGHYILLTQNRANPLYLEQIGGLVWVQKTGKPFETLLNEFKYYNCNKELGRGIKFYIPVADIDMFTGKYATKKTTNRQEAYDFDFVNKYLNPGGN